MDPRLIIQQLEKQILDLQEENKNLKKIIESTPGNLYWKNREHIYLGCNQGIANKLGLKACEDIAGHTIYDFLEKDISPEVAEAVNRLDDEIMSSGKLYEIEEIGFEGKTFITKKHPLYNSNNEVIGLLGISLDISDRKRMEENLIKAKEEAVAASRAKTIFLGNMSHDIRTPLNGILGFAQILELTENDPERKKNLHLIRVSAKSLLKLLNEIIDIAYVENGTPIKWEKVDLRAIISQIQDLLQADVIQKNLQFIVNIDDNVPATILSDKIRIHRTLLNLVANALKFTEQGYVKIACHLQITEDKQPYLEITLEDTGIGIAEKDKIQIFDNFTRLTPSDQSPYKGSGIGLYIVKTFINDLKGNISVSSQLNQGTKFTCKLPLLAPISI